MITLFGKVRYHWQPELSWSVIYWSIALTPLFAAMSLLYERAQFSIAILGLFALFVAMSLFGFRRYFVIETDRLNIATVNPFWRKKIRIESIQKLLVTRLSVRIVTDDHPEGRIFYMRKWPKKYFINALAIHPSFQGEVELTDHLIELDYFEEYYRDSVR